jgi:branched-chain amino acid transport system substrate-binding protein
MQLRQSGLKIPFVTGHGSFMKSTIESAGSDASDVYLTFEVDWKNLPAAQSFLKNYRAKYGEEGPYSVNGYDAANIVLRAIEQAGTTDAIKVADVMRGRIFPCALGTVQFDGKGDLRQVNFVVWTIKDGQFQVLP